MRLGALTVSASTEVVGIDVESGRIRRVRTSRGDIETEAVVVASGVWSPRIARMAGASIPLTPAVHQMIDVGPVPMFMETVGEIGFPIIRDVDTNMYERQHGSELEIGRMAPADPRRPRRDPLERGGCSLADRAPVHAGGLRPPDGASAGALSRDPGRRERRHQVRRKRAPLAHARRHATPRREPRGAWPMVGLCGVGEGGAGDRAHDRRVDDRRQPGDHPHASDIARFYEYGRTKTHIHARAREGYNKTYGIVHPSEQWESNRNIRLSPFYAYERELGAVFFETAGWTAALVRVERTAARGVRRPGDAARGRVGVALVVPIINAEHLAMRDRVGVVDLRRSPSSTLQAAGRSTTSNGSRWRRWTCRSVGSSTPRS